MANVTVDFNGFEDMRRKLEQLNSPQAKQACLGAATKLLAQVYLGEAIKNTPVGGAKQFNVDKKTYKHIRATEVNAKSFTAAKRQGNAAKHIKTGKGGIKRYMVTTASEHMRRSWGAGELKRSGKTYAVKVFNSASYASYVNDGHRQKPGRFVPILGKRLVKNYVEGLYITNKAEKKVRKASGKLLSQVISEYLRRGLGVG